MEKITYTQADIPPELVQNALFAQGACNGGALVHGLDRAIHVLQDIAHKKNLGTDWVSQHPIVTMYLAQLVFLNGNGGLLDRHMDAYAMCEKIAGKEVSCRQ
jgi:hypothetical protein